MRQNNLYTVNPLYDGTTPSGSSTDETGKSGGTTIIYSGGGLSSADREKLNSILYGALINQNAFGIIRLGDGSNTSEVDAMLPQDTADLKITGGGTIKVNLTRYSSIENVESVSTDKYGSATYLFNYGKVETPDPVPPIEGEDPKPPIITWPLTIKYVSGAHTLGVSVSKVTLLKRDKVVNTFLNTEFILDAVDNKVSKITILKEGLDFDLVCFVETTIKDEVTTDRILYTFKVPLKVYNTINIADKEPISDLWKLDTEGNLYTDRNVYSTKEVSAYGKGPGGGGGSGAGALYECADVLRDGDKVQGAVNGSLLSYNGSHWYAIQLSAITPDLEGYATQIWTNSAINTAVNKLVDSAPGTLDTLNEIAKALGDDPNFAATMTGLLNTLTIRVTDVENKFLAFSDMFEWDKSASASDSTKWVIKAKRDLFSVGEISAYGYLSSSAPTGALYLYELKDVDIDTLTDGLLLKYNGSKWVNVNANEVGLNETQLANYLTTNNYAKKSDIPSLAGYATETWITNLKFAKQSITVTGGEGLTGGGDLSSNRTISLSTVGTLGKYTKVTTDIYGRVVLGESASITDVIGLLLELDKKLNAVDFNKWFTIEYNEDNTIKNIKALYNFYSVGEITAYGGDGTISSIWDSIPVDKVTIDLIDGKLSVISDDGGKLTKNIFVNSNNVGHVTTGTTLLKDTKIEKIIRKIFYKPIPGKVTSSITTPSTVEVGYPKGTITFTSKVNDNLAITDSYYNDVVLDKLVFKATDIVGTSTCVKTLEGSYTKTESYKGTVLYSENIELEQGASLSETNITVEVCRKWFAGMFTGAINTSDIIRSLSSSGFITGPGEFSFDVYTTFNTVAFCVPSTYKITDIRAKISGANYIGNMMEDNNAIRRLGDVLVYGYNNSSPISYSIWVLQTLGTSDANDNFIVKFS